ncbi:MAG: iron-sulfur cluster assembly accessory protein [Chloroflexi bacterium]|nr:MAG: iron-sulfur cluster assembly accessory protein [Chloroflexota bacterium]
MLTMTDKAAEKAKALFEEKGVAGEAGLRVFVVGGGCSGYQYGMALAREFEDDDLVIDHSGVRIVVDPDSAPLLEGAEIDYVDDLMKASEVLRLRHVLLHGRGRRAGPRLRPLALLNRETGRH